MKHLTETREVGQDLAGLKGTINDQPAFTNNTD
jgi:hypothetical protein